MTVRVAIRRQSEHILDAVREKVASPIREFRIGTAFDGAALLILSVGPTVFLAISSFRAAGGHLTYALDDAYIHMTMGRNLAMSGNWSIPPEGLSSTSSSPLWTLLLTLTMKLFGDSQLIPWIWNLLFSGAVSVLGYCLNRPLGRWPAFFTGATLALFVPLSHLAMTGMEHTLHLTCSLLCLLVAFPANRERDSALPVGLVFASATLARFESGALILAVMSVAALRKEWTLVVSSVVGPALSLAAFVGFSVSQGGLPLPNSVVLKSVDARMPFSHFLNGNPSVVALFVAAVTVVCLSPRARSSPRVQAAMVTATLALVAAPHFPLPWGYRYHAWAVGLLWVAMIHAVAAMDLAWHLDAKLTLKHLSCIACTLWAVVACAKRTQEITRYVPTSCRNIYEQQVQMGRFLHEYYRGQVVVLNDIGATTYFGEVKCLDLIGLGTNEVARERLRSKPDKEYFRELADRRGAKVALVYDSWFPGQIPDAWTRVGTWRIPDNYVCGDAQVAFYAVAPAEDLRLRLALERFRRELPPQVSVDIVNTR